jgi:hypothetical protein
MTDVAPTEPDGIDQLIASVRASGSDLVALFAALRGKLLDALGARVTVSDQPVRRRRPECHSVAVALGDHLFEASLSEASLAFLDRQRIRGITLRSDEVDLKAWLDGLVSALREEAGRSEATRLGLERLLIS